MSSSASRRRNTTVTAHDVAMRANVSQATVSTVINGKAGERRISPATVKRIWQAAKELGYVPDSFGRGLRGVRTGPLGLLINTSIRHSYLLEIIEHLGAAAKAKGLHLTIGTVESDEDYEHFARVFRASRCEVVLLVGVGLGAEACIRHLEATGAWVVQVYGIPYPSHDYVGPDMAQAAVLASDYLWSRGRRAQALVVHDPEAPNWRGVTAAFRGRLRRHGLAKNAGRVFACECPSDFDRARGLAKAIAEEYPDCDGILACNDDVALGLVAGFRELGLEVPRDLEVVAHNNTYPVRIAHPPMPSTQYDLDEAARSAVEIAVMRMEDPEPSVPPKVVKLEPVFVSPTDQRKPLR